MGLPRLPLRERIAAHCTCGRSKSEPVPAEESEGDDDDDDDEEEVAEPAAATDADSEESEAEMRAGEPARDASERPDVKSTELPSRLWPRAESKEITPVCGRDRGRRRFVPSSFGEEGTVRGGVAAGERGWWPCPRADDAIISRSCGVGSERSEEGWSKGWSLAKGISNFFGKQKRGKDTHCK